jgi:hypothetical protein
MRKHVRQCAKKRKALRRGNQVNAYSLLNAVAHAPPRQMRSFVSMVGSFIIDSIYRRR